MKLKLFTILFAGLAALATGCIGPIGQEPPTPGCPGHRYPAPGGPQVTGSPTTSIYVP